VLSSAFRFIFQSIVAGLAVAFVAVVVFPDLLHKRAATQSVTALPRVTATGEYAVTPGEGPISYADAVAQAAPAVANVFADKRAGSASGSLESDAFFRRYFGDSVAEKESVPESTLGSAVIVSSDGYLLTNNHLIRDAVTIQVLLQDGRATLAKVVGTDPDTDLAVLKVDIPDLPTMRLRSDDGLRVGDVVLAIGNPFGVGQTVTMGIVSATGRHQIGVSAFEDFIQTDAAINPGNSGGALIDAHGRLIGINTAIFSGGSEGIGFAIPVAMARKVLDAIIERGYVPRGWLGAAVLPVTSPIGSPTALRQTGGVLVEGVLPGSPAALSGLIPGDIITHINGLPVSSPRGAINAVANTAPGGHISIVLLRAGEMKLVETRVGERKSR
jgi:serine protease DegS